MKLTLNNKLLIRAAERCSSTTDTRTGHPHTGKVRLSAVIHEDNNEHCMQAYATDLITQVDTAVTAQVQETGEAAIDCSRLLNVARAMPNGPVTLMLRSGRLVVKCSAARAYALPVIPSDLFPEPVEPKEDAARLVLKPDVLYQLLKRIQHCVAMDNQEHLRGAYIDLAEGALNAIAIGSHTMAMVTIPHQGKGEWAAMLPLATLRLVDSLCSESDELALIRDGCTVFVETEHTLLGGLLPQRDYPLWRNMFKHLPREPIARVPCVLFQQAVKAVCAGRTSDASDLLLKLDNDRLHLSLMYDECDAKDEVPVEQLTQKTAEWHLNPLYMLDAAKGADTDFVIENCDQGPILTTDDGYLSIVSRIMPKEEAREASPPKDEPDAATPGKPKGTGRRKPRRGGGKESNKP